MSRTFGGTGKDYAYAIAVDDLGNSYLTGGYSSTVDFDPGAGVDSRTSEHGMDIFVTRLNADGSYGWTRTFGGTFTYTNPYHGNGIALDSVGNVIIVGEYRGTVNFDMSGTGDIRTTGNQDLFLTKLGVDGSYGWTHSFGGSSLDVATAVAIDASDNIYVTGQFSGTVDFDAGTGSEVHTANGQDIFVAQYLPDGSLSWVKTIGGSSWFDIAHSIALGENGELYIAGEFESTVDFDPGTGVDSYTSASYSDAFISKFWTDGSYGWTRIISGVDSRAFSVAVGKLGDLFVGGAFYGTTDFDPSTGVDSYRSWGRTSDSFMTHLKADGSYGWTKILKSYYGIDMVRGIAIDPAGAVIEVGEYHDQTTWGTDVIDFDPGSEVDNIQSSYYVDGFVRKWDYSLVPQP